MRHLFAFIFLSLFSVNTFAQSHEGGTLSGQLDFDAGAHRTYYETKYNGTTTSQDTSVAGTTMGSFTLQYSIVNWLSVGGNYSKGSYIEDPDNAEANGNKISIYAFDFRLYPVNKDKFNWYLGMDVGGSKLEINRIYNIGVPIDAQYKFKSPHLGIFTGLNWYFANFIGINFQIGYSRHKFTMTEYNLNGSSQDLTNWNNVLSTSGTMIKLGLSFKIN